jgi:hypothetical protein
MRSSARRNVSRFFCMEGLLTAVRMPAAIVLGLLVPLDEILTKRSLGARFNNSLTLALTPLFPSLLWHPTPAVL